MQLDTQYGVWRMPQAVAPDPFDWLQRAVKRQNQVARAKPFYWYNAILGRDQCARANPRKGEGACGWGRVPMCSGSKLCDGHD